MESIQTHQEDHKPKETTLTVTSPLSSPTHEFSFTITIHPNAPGTIDDNNKKNASSPSFALDLAPADDIFFHGHLLPLQLLSHQPPISSRPSYESDIIAMEGLLDNPNPDIISATSETIINNRSKHKSFTYLSGLAKWWKGSSEPDGQSKRRRKAIDIGRLWKRYTSFIEPFFLSKGGKGRRDLRRRPFSFSGNSNPRESDYWTRRGQFSAPVSTQTSPTNSGLLLATPATSLCSSDGSSMEELQSAIQAAIAHCKNSTTSKELDDCI